MYSSRPNHWPPGAWLFVAAVAVALLAFAYFTHSGPFAPLPVK